MSSPIKFCHCRQCKYCLRRHAHAQAQIKKTTRKFRYQTKRLLRLGKYEEITDKISAKYFS